MRHAIADLTVGLLEPMIRRAAMDALADQIDTRDLEGMLDEAWQEYRNLAMEHSRYPTLGAEDETHLAARAIGLYRALLHRECKPDAASAAVVRENWEVVDQGMEGT